MPTKPTKRELLWRFQAFDYSIRRQSGDLHEFQEVILNEELATDSLVSDMDRCLSICSYFAVERVNTALCMNIKSLMCGLLFWWSAIILRILYVFMYCMYVCMYACMYVYMWLSTGKPGTTQHPSKKFFFCTYRVVGVQIELSKFYRRSLSRSHYNRSNRSLPSAWNNTSLRNRLIFSRY